MSRQTLIYPLAGIFLPNQSKYFRPNIAIRTKLRKFIEVREIDNFYLQKEEPVKSCLLFLRDHILNYDKNITEAWKYKMPFFCYKNKMVCYLWTNRKTGLPYIGVVNGKLIDHAELIQESRSRMKIFMVDPTGDLPMDTIDHILTLAIKFHK